MTQTAELGRPPARTPEREALHTAIAKLDSAQRVLTGTTAAIETATQARRQARVVVEDAQKILEQAKTHAAEAVVNGGRLQPGQIGVQTARDRLQIAQDRLAAAELAVTDLERRLPTCRMHVVSMRSASGKSTRAQPNCARFAMTWSSLDRVDDAMRYAERGPDEGRIQNAQTEVQSAARRLSEAQQRLARVYEGEARDIAAMDARLDALEWSVQQLNAASFRPDSGEALNICNSN